MKTQFQWFLWLALVFLIACEEEVELKLKSSVPKVFIEGFIRTDSLYQRITVKKTNNFHESNNYPGINDAIVILSDETGRTDTLQNIENGVFRTRKVFEGIPNRYYFLKIIAENTTYEAKAFLPGVVTFDTIIYTYVNNTSIVREPGYYLTSIGQEPLGLNYYRILCYKNDSLFDGIGDYFITDDILVEGNQIVFTLPFKFDKGDTAKVELWNIDQPTFYYYVSLIKQLFGGGPFAPPADNVKGNISNGALGYFGGCGVYSQSVIIE
jgi:hypothetical protein